MKKIFKTLLVIAALGIFVNYLLDNSCDLSGCENEATGWTNNTSVLDKSLSEGGCTFIPCKPIGAFGGYCSKDHALKDM